MDAKQFDAMTKRLSAPSRRRLILKGGAAAALGALAGALRLEFGAARIRGCGYKESRVNQGCAQDNDCCSRRCLHGKCQCSRPGVACRIDTDCCDRRQICFRHHQRGPKTCMTPA